MLFLTFVFVVAVAAPAASADGPLLMASTDDNRGGGEDKHDEPNPKEDGVDEGERGPRLAVDKVILKGRGEQGVEIEVRYHLIEVEELPGHPTKATLILDEESKRAIRLSSLQMLAMPISGEEAKSASASTLTFWDAQGFIKPGRPVTVMVAGLAREHVVPEAGPEYRTNAVAGGQRDAGALPELLPDAELKVHNIRIGGAGGLLHVTFTTKGVEMLGPAENSYVLDPQSGEKFPILRVPRIGLLAPKHLGQLASSYMVVENRGNRIKGGQRVSVVVAGIRQDNVLVEE